MFTIWRLKQTNACCLDLPSEIFRRKYVLAFSLPILEIWESANRWKAQLSLLLPLLVLRCRWVFPDECSRGAQPAYLANAPGEVNLLISPISPTIILASTSPQPEAVWMV